MPIISKNNSPIHMRGPKPNGRNAKGSIFFLFSLNQRSGLYSNAFLKYFSEAAVAKNSI